jgi:PKD repeat protein
MLVTMTLPTGMTGSPLKYTMSNVAAENSATAQLPTITAANNLAPGTYNINLTAKNMASNMTSVISVPIVVQ